MKVTVIAHPNSKKPRIAIGDKGIVHVYVAQKAQDGKANEAIARALSKHFRVAKSGVVLILGQHAKQKLFEIN